MDADYNRGPSAPVIVPVQESAAPAATGAADARIEADQSWIAGIGANRHARLPRNRSATTDRAVACRHKGLARDMHTSSHGDGALSSAAPLLVCPRTDIHVPG